MNISVIIPTFNRASLIERAVGSVLEQTVKPLEIIVVDDGSTDNTQEVIENIGSSLVKYVYRENGGAGAARNTGVKKASGDWIAFQDSDDVWRPDKLEKQVEHIKKHPEHGLVYTSYEMHLEDGTGIVIPGKQDGMALEGSIFIPLLIRNTVGAPTVTVQKKLFESVGGFDESLKSLEDWDFVLKFSRKYEIGFVDDITVDAYRVDQSVSANVADAYEYRCRALCENRRILEDNDLFERAVSELFKQAERFNCLDTVKKMFILYLSRG
jgi:glycosyltransferase involved in cell wall biosynthesis